MAGYLTPDTLPADTICRVLFIPNNDEFLANVTGALQVLISPEAWTKFGTLTPEQSANALVDMFDRFCFNEGACRVIGEIIAYAGTVSPDPTRWLDCNGASVLRTDYPDLFAVVGTTYGTADGTHFNLPDARGRVFVDDGTGPGLSPRNLGDSFGEEEHQLVIGELAAHSHTDAGHVHSTGNSILLGTSVPPPFDALGPNPLPAFTGSGSANIQSTGSDTPHNNMQPSLVIKYFIVALS